MALVGAGAKQWSMPRKDHEHHEHHEHHHEDHGHHHEVHHDKDKQEQWHMQQAFCFCSKHFAFAASILLLQQACASMADVMATTGTTGMAGMAGIEAGMRAMHAMRCFRHACLVPITERRFWMRFKMRRIVVINMFYF